ncbi:aminoglycoside adenylyltransferase family protein [Streptomonospora sediminis]
MQQEHEVVRRVSEVLGADLLGAYLHGSAVFAGLHPYSDIDVLVLARRRLTSDQRRDLTGKLLAISAPPEPGAALRAVELTIAVESDVRPWRYPPRCEYQYGEWLRAEFEQGRIPEPGPDPDLAVLVTMAREGNTALAGPPPTEVFDPVPQDDLVSALTAGIPELLGELESDTRNVVLTLARIWATLATGSIGSKDTSAQWALARLPEEHRPVLERARAVYLGDRAEYWDDLLPRLRPYAEYVTGTIHRLAP